MRQKMKTLVKSLTVLALGMPVATVATTKVWLIGGGNHIENSQGQIEQNVSWLEQLLQGQGAALSTYYSAGLSGTKDVSYWAPREESVEFLQPLARVFTGIGDNGIRYKTHELSRVKGGTDKSSLERGLTRDFTALSGRDDILLIYNGHGGINDDDVNKNYLKLWGDEKLMVSELDELLDKASPETTVRFVLTQCYSGAFHKLIYESPFSSEFSRQPRCGFMAESAWRQAEGCDLGVNKAEFRDYTTYFFAALNGQSRLGTALESDPDLNGDHKVSLREAHLYTLRNALSSDLSRATSETYLEQWQPWYLRWDSAVENKQSEYWKIAETVATRNGWTLDAQTLLKEKAQLQQRISDQNTAIHQLLRQIEQTQYDIQSRLRSHWPELFNPYTYEYQRTISNDLADIQGQIIAYPKYQVLVESQQRYLQMQQEALDLVRAVTQVDKIFRMKKLARLEKWFERYATEEEKSQRQILQECEEGFIE